MADDLTILTDYVILEMVKTMSKNCSYQSYHTSAERNWGGINAAKFTWNTAIKMRGGSTSEFKTFNFIIYTNVYHIEISLFHKIILCYNNISRNNSITNKGRSPHQTWYKICGVKIWDYNV